MKTKPSKATRTLPNPHRASSENQEILECIEEGLLNTLGASARAATLYFIESKRGMTTSRVASDPQGFAEALRSIFGLGSAELLRSILKQLRLKEADPEVAKSLRRFASAIQQAIESIEAGAL